MIETCWIVGAALEFEKGHRVPQKTEEYVALQEQGWEPAGPSTSIQTPEMLIVFVLMKRPRPRLNLSPGIPEVGA